MNSPTKVKFTIQSSQDTFSENSGHSKSNAIQSVIFRTPHLVKGKPDRSKLSATDINPWTGPVSQELPLAMLYCSVSYSIVISLALNSLAHNPVGFFLTPGMS